MRLPLTLVSAALFTACGPAQVSMDSVSTDVSAHVSELETELNGHATQAGAATSVSGIATLDASHRTMSLELLTKLDEMIGHMAMCMDDAKAAPNTTACKEALAKVRTGAETHSSTVAGMAGLTEARAEETRHHTELDAQMTILKAQATDFKSMSMKFMCPAESMDSH